MPRSPVRVALSSTLWIPTRSYLPVVCCSCAQGHGNTLHVLKDPIRDVRRVADFVPAPVWMVQWHFALLMQPLEDFGSLGVWTKRCVDHDSIITRHVLGHPPAQDVQAFATDRLIDRVLETGFAELVAYARPLLRGQKPTRASTQEI